MTYQPTEAPYDGPVMKTASQVAARYGVRTHTVMLWARRGHVTSHAGMYDLREVDQWAEQERMSPEPVWWDETEIAALFKVQVRTVRMWVRRGHITSHDGLYDLRRVLDWWENYRNGGMAGLVARRHVLRSQTSV